MADPVLECAIINIIPPRADPAAATLLFNFLGFRSKFPPPPTGQGKPRPEQWPGGSQEEAGEARAQKWKNYLKSKSGRSGYETLKAAACFRGLIEMRFSGPVAPGV